MEKYICSKCHKEITDLVIRTAEPDIDKSELLPRILYGLLPQTKFKITIWCKNCAPNKDNARPIKRIKELTTINTLDNI